jgi:hypothetical protein
MIYLVKYNNKLSEIFKGKTDIDDYEIIDNVCCNVTLLEINPYLGEKKMPIIHNLTNFIAHGIQFIYSYELTNIFIINSKHYDFRSLVRNDRIKKILK